MKYLDPAHFFYDHSIKRGRNDGNKSTRSNPDRNWK